jgi:hypothetical protein
MWPDIENVHGCVHLNNKRSFKCNFVREELSQVESVYRKWHV